MAREARNLTDYDRVMVYRFDPEWNGEVIAEEKHEGLEPYLGLHYPSSDIPAQARALYLTNRLRVIPDVGYQPVPLVPGQDGRTGQPLDLGSCLLRSVSPVHLEYLHNMGVQATLTASLVTEGRLGGLIACHHRTSRQPGPAEREACDLLARIVSTQLGSLAEVEDQTYRATLREILGRIGMRAGNATLPLTGLIQGEADLLALAGATGAVVWRAGRVATAGQTPPAEAIAGLMGWIEPRPPPWWRLIGWARCCPAEAFANLASGLLAVEVSRQADEYVLWFRPELPQTVTWGGDPHGKAGLDGRLSPDSHSRHGGRQYGAGRCLGGQGRWKPQQSCGSCC